MHDRQASRDPVHHDVQKGADDEPDQDHQQRCDELKAFEIHTFRSRTDEPTPPSLGFGLPTVLAIGEQSERHRRLLSEVGTCR